MTTTFDPAAKSTREEQGERLLRHLRRGRLQVRSSHSLARLIGVHQRSVGFIVSGLRREGVLVGSVHGEGYYIIQTQEELDETMGHIAARKRGIDMTLDAISSAWRQR